MPLPGTGLFGAIAGRHPSPQLKLHRLATRSIAPRVAEPRAKIRVPEEIMT
jgi:hypothetical protein